MSYKRWILAAVILFGVGVILGLTTPIGTRDLLSEELDAFSELGGILSPFSVRTLIFIFIRNASILLLSFHLSPIFCLLPVLALTANGWFLTLVSVALVQEVSVGFVLAGLLPHGVIELPAFILGEAAALNFGATVVPALFKKERRKLLLPSLKQNLRYLMVACVLLLPAAVIETYVTPLLLNRIQ